MRFFFIVQGEGRGHMTQAIALSALLRKNGHVITRVVVGRSNRRTIPDYFGESIGATVSQVESPNFISDNNRSVKLVKSILVAFSQIGEYRRSVKQIHEFVKEEAPDVIINFYDFIGGLYNYLKSPNARFITIAHQYLANHSSFEFPVGSWIDKRSFYLGNWLTSLRADNRLALSFQEYPDETVMVVPPLMRNEVLELSVSDEGYLLIYLLNHGYAEDIDKFHQAHPEVVLHCFWDKPDAPEELKVDDTLTYHMINGEKFITMLSSCKGYVTTAGFESVCEAMYLGKPVMMVPVEGHYEQACNALDACKVGAGVSSKTFDLDVFLDYLPKHKNDNTRFKSWCKRAEAIFLRNLMGDNGTNQ